MYGKINKKNVVGAMYFFVATITAMVQLALIARALSVEMAAAWVMILAAAHYLNLFDIGIIPTTTRWVAAKATTPAMPAQVLATARVVSGLFTGCAAGLLLIGAAIYMSTKNGVSASQPSIADFAVFLFAILLNIQASVTFAALEGIGLVHKVRAVRCVVLTVHIAILYAGLVEYPASATVAYAYLAQATLHTCGAAFLLRDQKSLQAGSPSLNTAMEMLRPGLQWFLTSLGAILLFQSSTVIVYAFATHEDVIRFDATLKLAFAIVAFSTIPSTTSIARHAALSGTGPNSENQALAMRNTFHAVSTASLLASFVAINQEMLFQIWLGPNVVPTALGVNLMMFTCVLEAHHYSLAVAAMSMGYTRFYKAAIFSGMLCCTLALSLVGSLQATGVVIALVLSQLLTNNWYVPFRALQVLKTTLSSYARHVMAPCAAVASVGYVLQAMLATFTEHLEIHLKLGFALGGCTFLLIIATRASYFSR